MKKDDEFNFESFEFERVVGYKNWEVGYIELEFSKKKKVLMII